MRIGEFARACEVNVETIRYYHRIGLLSLPNNAGSYRQYTQSHLDKMGFVKNAKAAGFTLDDIKHLEKMDMVDDRDTIRQLSEEKTRLLDIKITELEAAKKFLTTLVYQCKVDKQANCPILEALKIPSRPNS